MSADRKDLAKERKDMIQSYKDLTVYVKSYNICLRIYEEARKFPKEELYGLTSQIKRASTSIPLNIAEGYGKRESGAEFKRFLQMAIGSCDEMRVLLDLSVDLKFIEESIYREMYAGYDEIGKMLGGLYSKWK